MFSGKILRKQKYTTVKHFYYIKVQHNEHVNLSEAASIRFNDCDCQLYITCILCQELQCFLKVKADLHVHKDLYY